MLFHHKGLRRGKKPLSLVAYDRKTAILRVQIWSTHSSDVVGLIARCDAGHCKDDRCGRYYLNVARERRRSFDLMKKPWVTDTIQLRNRCPLRPRTMHLPAAYPRSALASLLQ